ncbi:alkaline phosphatase D family protein [Marinibacterium sp. SX1]|uniref:alkaline phosphatase D family protein n=1 Tax=Marinibacterium sp. SX1 TaxID=3388424 RepID=UPI003D167E5A
MTTWAEGNRTPVLYWRGITGAEEGAQNGAQLSLHALVARPGATPPGAITVAGTDHAPECIHSFEGLRFWRYALTLTPDVAGYEFEGRFFPVVTRFDGDLRLAFVSCNGEEHGDLDRDPEERNAMWMRLVAEHERAPMGLLLQGGDQIYADEVTDGHPLTDDWPSGLARNPSPEALADLETHLERSFVDRYMRLAVAPGTARILSEVPSLSIWDDHDICDGWGSLKDRVTDNPVARVLFTVARRMYLLFQQAMTEADLPALMPDATGANLGWRYHLPGLTLLAPDLRSQRRRHRVMGPEGWALVEETAPRPGDHTIMVSSVPLLGPRLSMVEKLLTLIPRMQKYEDDLRDQWQSHAHREEWRRMLQQMRRFRRAGPVTVVSGEIHLATRARMDAPEGAVIQLVASGIAHPAPPAAYATALGLLARFGEAPLPDSPIRILPLPGQTRRYVAERNFLVIDRRAGVVTARWHLEDSGITEAVDLS